MATKTLILVRHAHREVTFRSLDNGLSLKGQEQAVEIAKELIAKLGDLPNPPLLLSSAKVRCLETLAPLAHELGVKIEISPLLMEQLPDETEGAFFARIDSLIELWKTAWPDTVIACSHGDLLPLLIEKLTGTQKDLFKGEWTVVQL